MKLKMFAICCSLVMGALTVNANPNRNPSPNPDMNINCVTGNYNNLANIVNFNGDCINALNKNTNRNPNLARNVN